MSISGISGVATKTSFALFLLHSLFTSGVLGGRADEREGADLLGQGRGPAVPRPAEHPARRRPPRASTPRLGLPAEPFASVGFFAPPLPGDLTGRPTRDRAARPASTRSGGRSTSSAQRELLPYVFADVEDEQNQYTMVVHQVTARLRRDAVAAGNDGAVIIDGQSRRTWPDLVDLVVRQGHRRHQRGRRPWAGR